MEEQDQRLKNTWAEAGREWDAENGVDMAQVIEKGKIQPQGAINEHERLKSEGYDVY